MKNRRHLSTQTRKASKTTKREHILPVLSPFSGITTAVKKITFISLLPLLSQNSIVIQGNASGAFVECSHNQIIYSTIFFALIFPRTLIIIHDCRVKIRNFIYNEYSTSSRESFLNLAQQQIMWLADRLAELGQLIELGKKSVVL